MTDVLLVIFAKEPVPGQVKTRLCPPLGPAAAAALYRCFVEDVLEEMCRLSELDIALAYTPPEALAFFRRLVPPRVRLTPQSGGDLGERLTHACQDALAAGYRAVLVRNSDSPDLPGELIRQAAESLSRGQVQAVLGPAPDGGYYLVGLSVPPRDLFQDIPWSTCTVLAKTRERFKERGLSLKLLPPWADIDSFNDLKRFLENAPATGGPGARSREKARRLLASL